MGPGWARQEGGAGSPGCGTGAARSRPCTCTGAQAQAMRPVMPGCAEAPEARPVLAGAEERGHTCCVRNGGGGLPLPQPPNSLLSLLSLPWERPESGRAQVSL